jgi:signal transduction histidine kinase
MRASGSDRKGMVVIAVALAVISGVLLLVTQREVALREEQVRAQGVGLSSALSRVSLGRLVPNENRGVGPLPLLRSTQLDSPFSYAAIVDPRGGVLASVVGAGPLPEAFTVPADPSQWVAEISRTAGPNATLIREFTAPLVEEGQLVALVHIGFLEPTYAAVLRDLSFHAGIALLVFLLIPAAYLWLRSEMRPLQVAAAKLAESEDGGLATKHPPLSAEEIAACMLALSAEVSERASRRDEKRLELLASSRLLSHQKTRAESIVASLPDAILCLDAAGRVVSANTRAHGFLRREEASLIGEPLSAWCPSSVLAGAIEHSLRRSGPSLRTERVEFAAEGTDRRHFAAFVQDLPDGTTWIVVIRDVSTEVVARQMQAQFLSHMVHELKAPLNVISMYAETLLEPRAESAGERVNISNVIRDESQRMNALISSLFSLSRLESGDVQLDRQRVRTMELLSDLLGTVSRSGGESALSFKFEGTGLESPIYVDKALLSVAVNNLLTNAVKYNRPNGSVTLHAEESKEGLWIRVSDTGCGIAADELDRIFDRFFRSDDPAVHKVAGHGLGLSLVKEVVALHGGEVQVRSELGVGSEFTLFFSRTAAIFKEQV